MTPKEKAKKICDDFVKKFNVPYWVGQLYAESLVEEIIELLYTEYYDINNGVFDYWQEVKSEIENL